MYTSNYILLNIHDLIYSIYCAIKSTLRTNIQLTIYLEVICDYIYKNDKV